jgi:hypothetical protein
MASRSSSSTHSKNTMAKPSERSRSELPSQRGRAAEAPAVRGPSEKKHKNMAEVRATGRQSQQGGSPGKRASSRSAK